MEESIIIVPPITIESTDDYNLIKDSAGAYHHFNKDGSYEGKTHTYIPLIQVVDLPEQVVGELIEWNEPFDYHGQSIIDIHWFVPRILPLFKKYLTGQGLSQEREIAIEGDYTEIYTDD